MNVLINILKLLPEFLQEGKRLNNPEAWKKGQISVSMISGFLGAWVAISKLLGYELPITDAQIVEIASVIIAINGMIWNPAVTVATTNKIGIPEKVIEKEDKQTEV